ncbi:MAG: T9SS type A sorting domain-containing protein [Flavisolibacter sp.]
MKKNLFATIQVAALLLMSFGALAQSWNLSGNNNATSTSILGNTNAVPLRLFTKNVARITIDTFGFVGINSAHPVSTLDVRGTQYLSGQLKFGTGAHNIQFANPTTTANKPMIFMFTSGTQNPTRMVIAHSTSYPNYGLQYNDSTENFHFLGNGIPVLSVDLFNQAVSINSTLNLAGDVYQGSNRIIHITDPSTSVGIGSLQNNTTGYENTAYGNDALLANTSGAVNTANGYYSLISNTTGYSNSAFGNTSLRYNTTGADNTGFGTYALYNNTTGNGNTAIGVSAGDYTTNPNQGTFLGYYTTAASNLTNMTAIGYSAFVDASNKVVVGNSSVTSIGGYTNWTNFSDGRYKKNIKEDVPGLEFINQLRAVTYTIDVDGIEKLRSSLLKNMTHHEHTLSTQNIAAAQIKQPELSEQDRTARQEKSRIKYTGFVAQEVEKAAQKLGYDFSGVDAPKSKDGFYGLRYGDFVVPLVKAVQELSKKNEELTRKVERIDELENEIKELKALILDKRSINTLATDINLEQNIPNPARSSTSIGYSIPTNNGSSQLQIIDNLGRTVKTIQLSSSGRINLDLSSLSSGTYNYSLIVDGKVVETKKLVKASD